MNGAGIWLRLGSRPRPEEVVEHLDHVVVPLHSGDRGPIHVGPTLRAWCDEVRAGGVDLWGMDWLPNAAAGTAHVEATCDAARELGCMGLEADCEPDAGWRGATKAAVAYRLALAKHRGELDLAITDYGRGGIGDAALGALLAELDGHRPIGVPQSYDPQGTYKATYHARSVAYWRSVGAERVVLGVGGWLRGEKRHRTRIEMRHHLEGVPSGVLGVRAWYASASPLRPLLPILAEHGIGRGQLPRQDSPVQAPPRSPEMDAALARRELWDALDALDACPDGPAGEVVARAWDLRRAVGE